METNSIDREGPTPAEPEVDETVPPSELEVAVSTVLLEDDVEAEGNLIDDNAASGATDVSGTTTTSSSEEASSGSNGSAEEAVPVVAIIEDDSPRLSDR